jgi:ABC-type Fe3+-citrate transport system substrate-binding protein
LIGGFFNPSVEKIIGLAPDLVIVDDIHKKVITALLPEG